MGTFFYFDPFSKSIKNLCEKYHEAYIHNFDIKYFKDSLKEGDFHIKDASNIGYITVSGDNRAFSFHEDGERLHLYSFYGERNK